MVCAFNLIFGIWAKVLATFPKIGRFSFKSSGHSGWGCIFRSYTRVSSDFTSPKKLAKEQTL